MRTSLVRAITAAVAAASVVLAGNVLAQRVAEDSPEWKRCLELSKAPPPSDPAARQAESIEVEHCLAIKPAPADAKRDWHGLFLTDGYDVPQAGITECTYMLDSLKYNVFKQSTVSLSGGTYYTFTFRSHSPPSIIMISCRNNRVSAVSVY